MSTGKERVLAALNHKCADRVPTFEWLIDETVIDALMPGADYYTFSERYMDGICTDLNYDKEDIGEGQTRNEWGIIQVSTGESHPFPIDGAVHNREELEAFEPPSPDKPGRYATLEKLIEKYGDEKAVVLHMNDVWSLPSRMMKFEDFMMMLVIDADFVADLVKMTVDAQILLAEGAAKRGVEFLYTGDDVAYNSGPMLSPDMFRELFLPELKRIFGAYRDLGFRVMKHTDGNIMPLVDMYLDAKIELLDPIDPVAGMDLAYMKSNYGDKIALKGNVNCATTLVYGSTDDTIAETRRCLDIGMPGGGYIISSSNTIHSSVKPENFKAMLETVEEYGRYDSSAG
jgi:uroporphyrinogen decarboxylase